MDEAAIKIVFDQQGASPQGAGSAPQPVTPPQQQQPPQPAATQSAAPTPAAPKPTAPPPAPEDYFVKQIGREFGVFKQDKRPGRAGFSEGVDVFGTREQAEALVKQLAEKAASASAAAPTPAAEPQQPQPPATAPMEAPDRASGLDMDDVFGDPAIAAAKDRAEADALRAKKQPPAPAAPPPQPATPVAPPPPQVFKAPEIANQLRQEEQLVELEERRQDIAQDEQASLALRRQAYATYFAESEAGYRKQQQRIRESIADEQLEQRQVLANLQARRDYFRTPQGREQAQSQASLGRQVDQAKFEADWAQLEAEKGKLGAAMAMAGREIGDIGVILPGWFGSLFGKISQFQRAFESVGRIAGALFGGAPAAAPGAPTAPTIAAEEIPYGEVVQPPVAQLAPQPPVAQIAPSTSAGQPTPPQFGPPSPPTVYPVPQAKPVFGPPAPPTVHPLPEALPAGSIPEVLPAAGAAEAAGAAGGMMAAAGPIGMAVAAAVAVVQGLNSAVSGTIHAMGSFAAAIASPDMNPAAPIGAAGSAIEGFGSKVLLINPALGIFATALGSSLGALAQFMGALDGLANRYAQYSPQIGMAQGMAEMRTTMGEVQRANRIGPAMSEYIGARTDLQEQFENIKIRLLQALLPIATQALGKIGAAVEYLEKILDAALESLEALASLPGIPGGIKDAVKELIAALRPEANTELPWDINTWVQGEIGGAANWLPGG